MCVYRDNEAFRETIFPVEKQNVTNSGGIQHATHMAILPSTACPVLPYLPHFLTNGRIFNKKVIEYKISVLISSTTFV